MNERTAVALVKAAVESRAAMRRGDDTAIERFERQYADMREAMDWFLGQDRLEEADRFGTALIPFWMTTKRIDDGDAWFQRALGDQAPGDARRARALYDHGYLIFWAGHHERAERRFREARRLAEDVGDPNVVALALAGSARVALNEDPARAVALLREAMEVTRDLPESEGHSSADHVLGVALQMAGDLEGARDVMTARLEHARATGNTFVLFVETANLSMVERQLGNLDTAEHLALDALRYAVANHDEMSIPWSINGLAAVTAAQGRLERAATLAALAASLLAQAGGEWPPDERQQYEGTLAAVAAGLDPGSLEQARAAGAAMTRDEGVAFALSS